ncbi:TIGR02206 family membrane protein [Chloroflexota bacterium]
MAQFFAKEWAGGTFVLFGPAHLLALGVVVFINILIVVFRRRFSERSKRIFRYTLAALLVVDELMWHWWNYSIGQWTVQTMLPLHLCSVLVFVSAYMLVTKNYRIFEFTYFLGIAGAMQALLTPDAGQYGFPHFRAFQVMVSHGAIVTSAIYMTFVEGLRPYWSSLRRVAIGTNLYMLFVMLVNWLLGSNYLFIARKPDTASLMDVLGPWPWYILSLEAVGLALCLLLYLPYAIRDRRTKTQAAT